jgi:hypothetical protein
MPDVTFPKVGGIFILRAGHGAGAADMRFGVERGLEVGVFRAAHSGPMRTAGLRHEPLDHPMEGDAVVEFFSHELLDMRDSGRNAMTTGPCVACYRPRPSRPTNFISLALP